MPDTRPESDLRRRCREEDRCYATRSNETWCVQHRAAWPIFEQVCTARAVR